MLEVEHARKLLAEFNMPEAACQLDALLETATAKDSTFISFLDQLLSFQQKERTEKAIRKRMKAARIPTIRFFVPAQPESETAPGTAYTCFCGTR